MKIEGLADHGTKQLSAGHAVMSRKPVNTVGGGCVDVGS